MWYTNEDLGLAEIKVKISILFEDGIQFWNELRYLEKWTDDTDLLFFPSEYRPP
jgi:hypothetical protein